MGSIYPDSSPELLKVNPLGNSPLLRLQTRVAPGVNSIASSCKSITVPSRIIPRSTSLGVIIGGATLVIVRLKVLSATELVLEFFTRMVKR